MIHTANIPQELKDLPHWINFKTGEAKGTKTWWGHTRYKKIPLHPDGREWFNVKQDATYRFDEVILPGPISDKPRVGDGIAFVLKYGSPYVVLDMDSTDHMTCQEALGHDLLIQQLNSYTQKSFSESGYHVFVKVNQPVGRLFAESEYSLSLLTGGTTPNGRYDWVIMTGNIYHCLYPTREIKEIDFNTSILQTLNNIVEARQAVEEEYGN